MAFVPTMGALHEGHLALMRQGRQLADHLAVSIFVNPAQFAPHEDLDRYPRPIETDLRRCEEVGVDLVFNPTVEEMYPPDAPPVHVEVPSLGGILEGEHRPHFFGGVCRIVAKLLHIVQPDVAVFGMKDYQQLRVVEAMTRGLNMATSIEAGPTIREADGLAMSSRNVYLDAGQRKRALALSRSLTVAREAIEGGAIQPADIERLMRLELEAHDLKVDYAVVRDAVTLEPVDLIDPVRQRLVCLVAAWVEQVRLIDNAIVAEGVAGA